MLTNTILFIPSILMKHRFSGTIPSMLLSVLIGSVLTYLFTHAMMTFNGKGIPEILEMFLPKWVNAVLLIYLGFMWFASGGLVAVSYSRILQRFVNPDLNLFLLIAFLGIACGWVATNGSRSVMYLMEIVLLLNLPMIGFILFKTVTNENMDWDAVRVMIHYVWQWPNWESLAASTYVFTGYINWAIFNRTFRVDGRLSFLWIVTLTGTLVLTSTFIIPIGFFGTLGVDDFIYTWVSTADSMRMEFGFVERVLFVFLLLYLNVAMLFITVTWHVGAELMKSVIPKKYQEYAGRRPRMTSGVIIAVFLLLSEWTARMFDEKHYMMLTSAWFQLRLPSEVALVLLIFWLGRRSKS
ncbi:GerAB/ArcD/ProY family transporter [Paenibacillus hexagrammi]|uniref:GerAB/ArcD/ProY family transporter n=1 Tax=Paenibacillus hexagrammi TaxID=2908839 RepID=A0ABY3SJN4_9BACL|nr:GerAB/ArcD/ProY family transporter [Paenibacillus sp. YPD9-1]UJF34052.1 GerAB/ArcD/ProY family transporter [Paenibacillus sp. YPD9-1]